MYVSKLLVNNLKRRVYLDRENTDFNLLQILNFMIWRNSYITITLYKSSPSVKCLSGFSSLKDSPAVEWSTSTPFSCRPPKVLQLRSIFCFKRHSSKRTKHCKCIM